jgi:hypothetical protein
MFKRKIAGNSVKIETVFFSALMDWEKRFLAAW